MRLQSKASWELVSTRVVLVCFYFSQTARVHLINPLYFFTDKYLAGANKDNLITWCDSVVTPRYLHVINRRLTISHQVPDHLR